MKPCRGGMWAAAALVSMLGCAADDADDSGPATETPGTGSSGGAESSSGSGSTGAESTTGDVIPSLLAQCDAPEPCDPFAQDPGSNLEEVDPALECAVNQALDSLANGIAAELHSSFCDIGCTGQDVLLVGDGTAYIQTWTTTADTSYDVIQRCTLKDASYFEPCAGPPPTTACAGWSAWMENCEEVESVTCPS